AGQGFFDDTVVAELFGGDGQAGEQPGQPELADGLPGVGGLAGDQQVRAGGGGAARVAGGGGGAERGGGGLLERPGGPRRAGPPGVERRADQAGLVEARVADLAGQRGVDAGQGHHNPERGIVLRRGGRRGEQVRWQRGGHRRGSPADADPAGGVGEDQPLGL